MDLNTMYGLIKRQGTLEQVSNFLRARNLPHSGGSWAQMVDARLKKAVAAQLLSDFDVLDLLRQTEEHGSQHIFLYTLVPGRNVDALFDARFPQRLVAAGLPALGTTSIVDMPDKPTVVEVRMDQVDGVKSVVFKIVDKRSSLDRVSDTSKDGQFIVTYNEIPYRAVNIMRITADGRAEIRVQSHSDAISYSGLTEAVFSILKSVVDRLDWKDEKLDKFKDALLDAKRRTVIMSKFGLRHTQHTNTDGTRLTASAGIPGASMYDDTEVVASVDRFLSKKGHAHCDRASVTMRKGGSLSRDVGLVVSGDANEFAITSKVSRAEYEAILRAVVEHNI